MINKLKKLEGIFPIIYCFFNKNNSLDKKIIIEQINLINKIGSNGIASLGLATEVNKLSFEEKKIIIELVAENSNSNLPTAVTIQGNSFKEYLKLIDIAKQNEADWIILQPLIQKKTTDKDCFNFFKKLIPYTNGSIVGIQNAKEYLGVGLSAKEIIYLYKEYNNFRAIKGESSSVFMQKEIEQYPNSLKVFNGRGGQEIVDNFLIGCDGIVPALDGADKFLKIYKFIKNNNILKANSEYSKILPSIIFIMQSINTMICYGKRVCGYRMGIKNIYDRKPFLEPSDYGIKKSKQIAKELGKY
jgi:4-hydroxy-tetrahydrodipicolinate synthase